MHSISRPLPDSDIASIIRCAMATGVWPPPSTHSAKAPSGMERPVAVHAMRRHRPPACGQGFSRLVRQPCLANPGSSRDDHATLVVSLQHTGDEPQLRASARQRPLTLHCQKLANNGTPRRRTLPRMISRATCDTIDGDDAGRQPCPHAVVVGHCDHVVHATRVCPSRRDRASRRGFHRARRLHRLGSRGRFRGHRAFGGPTHAHRRPPPSRAARRRRILSRHRAVP